MHENCTPSAQRISLRGRRAQCDTAFNRGSSLMNDMRIDERDAAWPSRPWLMAGICALAGLAFWLLVDDYDAGRAARAAAAGLAVTTVAFVLTVEARRWLWSVGVAVGWGLIIGLIAYVNGGYGRTPTIFEWPLFAGIFALLLAAPLFQSLRDHGHWRFPAALAHEHVWTDAVIGALSLAFVGLSFALTALIGALFDLIGIDLIQQLLIEEWFGWMLAGAAFGGAVGLLRERDALVATIHRLAMVVLGVLAPVLAAALILFLVSLPITGLSGLWDSWASAAALTLAAGAGAMVLANAALGHGGDGREASRLMRYAALALTLAILPLALLAVTAMGLRIGQYGWTPERLWGVLAAVVGIAFGVAGWWAVARERLNFAGLLQQWQVWIGMGVCGIALFLALPIVDFGAISARDQLARLRSGAVSATEFDWQAMAFDFGPAGRATLSAIARGRDDKERGLARQALAADVRWGIASPGQMEEPPEPLEQVLQVRGAARPLVDELRTEIINSGLCQRGRCIMQWLDDRRVLIVGQQSGGREALATVLLWEPGGEWRRHFLNDIAQPDGDDLDAYLEQVAIEVRPVTREQLVIGGEVVGDLPLAPE
jgi:hypothetical protein